jgi:chromosomal replication initiator protein
MLQGMEDRLLTRFKWGLVAELERPDMELRKNIMRNKVRRDGLNIPESVISYIAENVNESVRELEGIITSLLAQSIIFKRDVDLQMAKIVIGQTVHAVETNKTVSIDDIISKVCAHYEIEESAIHTKTRKREVVQVRQLAMYLAKKYTDASSSKIGQYIGKKDHATVLHACKMIKDQVEVDKAFKAEVEEIEADLHRK